MRRANPNRRSGDSKQYYGTAGTSGKRGASRAPPLLKANITSSSSSSNGRQRRSPKLSNRNNRSYSKIVLILFGSFFLCGCFLLGIQKVHLMQTKDDTSSPNLRFGMPLPLPLPLPQNQNPQPPTYSQNPEWDDPIIHIVNTRFMQSQGHLPTLAQARLHLFSTFCLPSMLGQSTQNFIWIIKIDPNLTDTIRNELVSLVKTTQQQNPLLDNNNIYIVASDVNYLIGHDPGNWRMGQERDEVWSHVGNGTVYTGNLERLWAAKELADEKIILETRLDADDGLHCDYLQTIQEAALQKFDRTTLVQDQGNGMVAQWFYWCVERHVKWYLDMGQHYYYQEDDIGFVETSIHTDYCITPGLTVGWNVKGTNEPFVNANMLQEPPTNISHADLYHHILHTHQGQCGLNICMERIQTPLIAALRTRTFTSAGMKDVDFEATRDQEVEVALWETIQTSFEVSTIEVVETQQYFRENVIQIARENLEGQCSKGMFFFVSMLFEWVFSMRLLNRLHCTKVIVVKVPVKKSSRS